MPAKTINYPLLALVVAATVLCTVAGLKRLTIDSDLSQSLPKSDPVIADALAVFQHHPIHDQVAVDLEADGGPDTLVRAGESLQKLMRESQLFQEVGMESFAASLPQLRQDVIRQLPLLFSTDELARNVAPLLSPATIEEKLTATMADAAGLTGIGQAETLAADPLALHQIVMAKLAALNPGQGGRIYRGNLLSSDGRHLLALGKPKTAGSDTEAAQQMHDFFHMAETKLQHDFPAASIRLTPVGAWRAAFDNETQIRKDVELAITISTVGIILLLILAFPRPLFSLLSQIPPIAGTAAALFIYSLFHSSISVMVLGFAGALISVMDDFSITYLIFFDRKQATSGKQTAAETQSIGGGLALFTTIVSFAVLAISDFPVFAALGEFAALGMICTFLFIYFICPRLMPEMPPAKRRGEPPLHRVSAWIFSRGGKGCLTACLFAIAMLVFARPQFHISLADMNSMTPETLAADRAFTKVWGQGEGTITLMAKADSLTSLQAENDRLEQLLTTTHERGILRGGLSPTAFYPGAATAGRNFAAWQEFWTPSRAGAVIQALNETGARLGFADDAFAPFIAAITEKNMTSPLPLPPELGTLLGFSNKNGDSPRQFILASPGEKYDANTFRTDYGQGIMIGDGAYFAKRLGDILFAAFGQSLIIVAVAVSLAVFLALLDWRLTLIALAPMLFASICTLGTLYLLGRPLDIPALMLVVVIFGLGIDFSIYLVCGYQYYGAGNHPNYRLLQSAVLLSAASTVIGFGALIFARHSILHSIGVVSLCGLGYSLLGAILLLPPILTWYFQRQRQKIASMPSVTENSRILNRYRPLPAWPRMFARGKLRGDSLFAEMEATLTHWKNPKKVIDIGCGYGLPACWLLEHFSGVHIYGCDPDPKRVFFAQQAVADRGDMQVGAAPDLPQTFPGNCDLALLLDMAHYLDDERLRKTFTKCRQLLHKDGGLLARFVIRPAKRPSLSWLFEDWRTRLSGLATHYRTLEDMRQMATAAGFSEVTIHSSAKTDMFWLVAL